MTAVLVTGAHGFGAAGFIGVHLVDKLKLEGFDVLEFKGDVRNPKHVQKNFSEKVEIVYHLAAQVSPLRSITDPIYDLETNALGTLNILNCARKKGVQVVYTSSAAVYGEPKYLPIDEDHPLQPLSPYGLSKLTAERYCLLYQKIHNLPVTVLRISNVYGPRGHGVINTFLRNIRENKPLTVYGDGEQSRDFIYVEDVTQALIKAEGKEGVYNIGTGKPTSINQLIKIIEELTGRGIRVKREPTKLGDIKHSYFNIEKAKRILQFNPKITLKEGIKNTL